MEQCDGGWSSSERTDFVIAEAAGLVEARGAVEVGRQQQRRDVVLLLAHLLQHHLDHLCRRHMSAHPAPRRHAPRGVRTESTEVARRVEGAGRLAVDLCATVQQQCHAVEIALESHAHR